MALGTITTKPVSPGGTSSNPGILYAENGLQITLTTVVGDSSYVAGGSPLTPQQLGLANDVIWAECTIVAATGVNSAAVSAWYNDVTNKLQMFVTGGVSPVELQEAAAAANLSGLTVRIKAYGF